MRPRFNPNAVCSSRNYKTSKRVHYAYLRDKHDNRVREIEGMAFKIANTSVEHHYGRPYVLSWGHKVYLPLNKVEDMQAAGFAIHYGRD